MAFGTVDRSGGRGAEQDAMARQIVLRPPRLGVVVFNNPANPTSGVAAVTGRALAFDSRTELPSDVLWISTARMAATVQNFRPADFLRVRPFAIAEDIGVQLDDVVGGLPEVAKTLGSIRDIAAQAYPWSDFSVDWSYNNLPASIARVLPGRGEVHEFLESPLAQATQSYSVVQDRPAYSSSPMSTFTLRVNRLCYAQWLLSGHFPAGGWHLESRPGRFSLDDLLDPSRPCLVEASVEFGSSDIGGGVTPALVSYGSSMFSSGKEVLRRWISQPELAWLSRFATIHISSVLMCRESKPLPPELALPGILTADPLLTLSVSAGVVAECHWNALASPGFVRRPGSGGTSRFVPVHNPLGVWVRALDRAYTFAMARKAASLGFNVSAYGYGSVTVWSSKDDLRPMVELSEALQCCHPNLAAMHDRISLYAGAQD